jgi:hypothetical protein
MRWRCGKLAAVVVAGTVTVAACAQTVDGAARRATTSAPDPERSYGYVDDRCGLLQDSTVQDMLGAESVVRPYSGAVCQYVLVRATGLVDVVFSWFETGTLDRERDLATDRGAQVMDTDIERHPAFTATTEGNPAACAATAAAGTGVLTWWVQFRPSTGMNACRDAEALLAATLSSDM